MYFRRKCGCMPVTFSFLLFLLFLYFMSTTLFHEKLDQISLQLHDSPLITSRKHFLKVKDMNNSLFPTGEASKYIQPGNQFPVFDHLDLGPEFDGQQIHRIVHFDLKGAPPSLAYMREIFPLLRSLGATGLLMEYEDMFPYWGELSILAKYDAYNISTINEIVKLAHENKLIVIPLVQSFGHFEFVLKHKQFQHLREVPDRIQNLNPGLPASMTVVSQMIDQVLALHPLTEYIHIGGDEVRSLGLSPESKRLMEKKRMRNDDLFLYHVTNVLTYIKTKYPRLKRVMWDDMLRKIGPYKLKAHDMGSLVEPMVWLYVPGVGERFSPVFWAGYTKIFPTLWTASSFKGATGQSQYVVDIGYHVSNNAAWIRVMTQAHNKLYPKLKIRGIVLTGWQRYDHMLPLCELLPVGIPSLAINLHIVTHYNQGPPNDQLPSDLLKCERKLPLKLPRSEADIVRCNFPGNEIYRAINELKLTRVGLEKFLKSGQRNDTMRDLIKQRILHHVNNLPRALLEIYGHDTVREFITMHVIQPLGRLSDVKREAQDLLSHRYPWMRPTRQI